MTAPNTGPFYNQLLADLGITAPGGAAGQTGNISAQGYQNDLNFLQAWGTSETGGNMPTRALNNPLDTTEPGPGSYPINSVGVMAYPSLQEGASIEAGQIEGPVMQVIWHALQSGNPTGNAAIDHALSVWGSQGFANNLASNPLFGEQAVSNLQNQPGVDANNIDKLGATFQGQFLQQLASANQNYANQSAQFAQQNLDLSRSDLNIQLQALMRQLGSGKNPGLLLQNYQLSRQQLERQMQSQYNQSSADLAGAGSTFTHGGQEQLSDILSSRASQEKQMDLNYAESVAQAHDRQKTLFDLAEKYNISQEQIQARLTNQLANIQYGADSGETSLAMQMAQDDASTAQLEAMPVYPQQTAGIPSTYTPGG